MQSPTAPQQPATSQPTQQPHPISPINDGAVYREQRDRDWEREREREVRTTPMVPERDTNGTRPSSETKVQRQIQKPEVRKISYLF